MFIRCIRNYQKPPGFTEAASIALLFSSVIEEYDGHHGPKPSHQYDTWAVYGCQPKNRVPQNGWFIMVPNPIKMDDLGGNTPIFGNTHMNLQITGGIEDGEIWGSFFAESFLCDPTCTGKRTWNQRSNLFRNVGVSAGTRREKPTLKWSS